MQTWLFGITEKVVRHRRRKDRLRHWLAGSSGEVARHLPAAGPNQHEQLERKESIAQVYRVLDRLSERDRQILILFELEEMPGEQIASLLGIKVANVWLRMHRARERFLKAYRESESASAGACVLNDGDSTGRYGHAG